MKWGIGLFLKREVLKRNWEILWALRRFREWLSSLVGGRRSFVLSISASPSANLRQWSSLLVASDSISQSLSALVYDKKLWPRTILHARRWTCSMVLVCLSVRDEFHTTSAYSKRGRMLVSKAASTVHWRHWLDTFKLAAFFFSQVFSKVKQMCKQIKLTKHFQNRTSAWSNSYYVTALHCCYLYFEDA